MLTTTSASLLAVNGPAQGREFTLAGGVTQVCYRDAAGGWFLYLVQAGDAGLELVCAGRVVR